MAIRLHPHARTRASERGATEGEVIATVEEGEQFPVKYGRTGFRRNFSFGGVWGGKHYLMKQVEAYAVKEGADWVVLTVLIKFF
jgi:hypothetical protein